MILSIKNTTGKNRKAFVFGYKSACFIDFKTDEGVNIDVGNVAEKPFKIKELRTTNKNFNDIRLTIFQFDANGSGYFRSVQFDYGVAKIDEYMDEGTSFFFFLQPHEEIQIAIIKQ